MSEIDALGRAAHLLIVDDDARIRELLQKFLARHGAACTVAPDAAAARRLLDSFTFDLLILDVTMPGEDGFSLLQGVRKAAATPVILLTARGLAEDRIRGLSLGADDYLAKPFEPMELVLRINALLRRSGGAGRMECVRFGPFEFAAEAGVLTQDGAPVHLTETEAAALKALCANPGGAVAREELARRLATQERSVDVLITRLRRKLEEDPRAPRYLQTVRGVGYRLALD